VESCFNPFRGSGSVIQDRCTVFAKRTIGPEIVLDTPDGTSR
jgi:hypothetical protein